MQVRLSTGGAPLVKAFNSDARESAALRGILRLSDGDAALSEVAEWIASENLSYDVSSVKLSTTFPRYVGDMPEYDWVLMRREQKGFRAE